MILYDREKFREFYLPGGEISYGQIQYTTFEDAKALSDLYEEYEYEKRKSIGLRWSPVRAELYSLHQSHDDDLKRMDRQVRKLRWIVFADTAVLAALAIILFILRGGINGYV